MCKYLREALTEQRRSQPKPSLQQAVVRTEDEDVLQALEMGGLIFILLLFRQLLGDHASVAETRSQPGGKPTASSLLPHGSHGGNKLLPSPWRRVSTQSVTENW